MAVPSSGQLRLYADIGVEIGVAQSNVSLGQMSDTAGFAAPDAMGDFYGYSSIVLGSVNTCAMTSVGTTTMRICGYVNDLGGAANLCRGFYFGPYSNYTQNSKIQQSATGGTGAYCLDRTGLNPGSTYYNRAWVCNEAGQAVATNQCSATTVVVFPATIGTGSQVGIYSIDMNQTASPRGYQHAVKSGGIAFLSPNQGWIGTYNQSNPGVGGAHVSLSPRPAAINPGIKARIFSTIGSYPGWGFPGHCGQFGHIASFSAGGHGYYGSSYSKADSGHTTVTQSNTSIQVNLNQNTCYGTAWNHAGFCTNGASDIRLKTNISYL